MQVEVQVSTTLQAARSYTLEKPPEKLTTPALPQVCTASQSPFSDLTQRKDPRDTNTWGSPVKMPGK